MWQRFSSLVQQQRGSWGILILALWAVTLAFVAFARMLLLTAVVGVTSQENLNQDQIWAVFILNAFFGLAFVASAYGLWARRNWGRLLFCGLIIVWAVSYIIALLMSNRSLSNGTQPIVNLLIGLLPYIFGSIVSVWYLNLAHIKELFESHHPTQPTNE